MKIEKKKGEKIMFGRLENKMISVRKGMKGEMVIFFETTIFPLKTAPP